MHNFNRTVKDVAKVVRLSEGTIRKRCPSDIVHPLTCPLVPIHVPLSPYMSLLTALTRVSFDQAGGF